MGHLPSGEGEPEQWYNLSINFKVVNYPVQWDKIDNAGFSQRLAMVLAYILIGTNPDYKDLPNGRIMTVAKLAEVAETEFIGDDEIARFLEEQSSNGNDEVDPNSE